MDEPPAKRARRIDSAAMWDKNDSGNRSTASPRSPLPHSSDRDSRSKHVESSRGSGYGSRRDDDRRRRSRSPRDRNDRNKAARSRSPRERDHRDRDRDRDRIKESDGRRERERSRSRDRQRNTKDHRTDRKRERSRSPFRNGESATPIRKRSPPLVRPKKEEREPVKDIKDIKPHSNGTKSEGMDVDDDDLGSMMNKIMGFSTFKTTQNTKVPGNQIYGVRKEKKTEYRQYMNRVGGFNRPLSPG